MMIRYLFNLKIFTFCSFFLLFTNIFKNDVFSKNIETKNQSISDVQDNIETNEKDNEKYLESPLATNILTPTKIVEDFFNNIKSFKADFIQLDGKSTLGGVIAMKKVGNIRLEYTSGISILVVVKDNTVSYYDSKREQISHLPADKTIVSLLIKRLFLFTDPDIKIISQKMTDESISIEFEKAFAPDEGTFTLVFKRKNKLLPISSSNIDISEMKVRSREGELTHLKITKILYDVKLSDDFFVIKNAKTQINNKFKE